MIKSWSDILDYFAENCHFNRGLPNVNIVKKVNGDGGFEFTSIESDLNVEFIQHNVSPTFDFPKNNDADMVAYYGKPGSNHAYAVVPYPIVLAWDTSVGIKRFTVNERIKTNVEGAMADILQYYGLPRIKELSLDKFGGCFNNRKVRGGKRISTHAYACSIDWHPTANRLRWGSDRAAFAKAEYKAFLDIWENHGAVSLGRLKNFDWMHVQFTDGV